MMKKFFLKKNLQNEEMTLQITSMADIFTIILVFLLKSYATSAVNISPLPGMRLAEAQAPDFAVEAIKLEISENAIQVEGQPVTLLRSFHFQNTDLQSNGVSQSLAKALEKERKRELLIAQSKMEVQKNSPGNFKGDEKTNAKIDQKILIISDQKTPYSTLKSVLASAALNGYTDFKLVVVREN